MFLVAGEGLGVEGDAADVGVVLCVCAPFEEGEFVLKESEGVGVVGGGWGLAHMEYYILNSIATVYCLPY